MPSKIKPKGFTMVELLVVIIIIALVAGIGGNNFKRQRSSIRYNDSILTVNNMIKTARNYAVTSRAVWDTSQNPGEESYVPPEGYGVYIERSDTPGASRVILFANTDAVTDPDTERERYEASDDVLLEEYILPLDTILVGLSIDKIDPIGGHDTQDKVAIIFRPPLAEVTMAVNDEPTSDIVPLDDLYLEFRRADAHVDVASKYIHINRIAGFSEFEK